MNGIIKEARQRKPLETIPATQSMFLDFFGHFSPLFKKVVGSSSKASLNIQKARVLEYSAAHASEVWVKYTVDEEEEWSKFQLLKSHATASLPAPTYQKYKDKIPIKANKVVDIQKMVNKYVPEECRAFYDTLSSDQQCESAENDTEESDD